MAHFAEIDDNGIVLRVLVVDNSQEHRGQEFLADELGLGGTWIQTSYNDNFRKRFAGIGFKYDKELDVFINPKCHEEAIFDRENAEWSCDNDNHKSINRFPQFKLPKEINNVAE
jgi:hypothetical protein